MTVFSQDPLIQKPRILFMGTPDFAVPTLKSLVEWGVEIVAVVSQPDRPKGRGKKLQRTPVATCADELNLPVYQWKRLSNVSYDILSDLSIDLAVVIAYGKILPARYLNLPTWGCINLHGSLLPAYRGAAPIQWSIMSGETETGISVMRLDEGMDTGPVALMKRIDILPHETSDQLYSRLANLAADSMIEALNLWVQGNLSFHEQNHDQATHAPMLRKEDGLIDWQKKAENIACLIRGIHPWPGAFTHLSQEVLKVHRAEVLSDLDYKTLIDQWEFEEIVAGKILGFHDKGLLIACGSGALCLTEVQRPSKKRIQATDFIKSYPLQIAKFLHEL
jgi:methionyl-tRNA formyltransferase